MSTSPMVEQVNRMVGNLLAWSGEVAFPGIGSLYVERRAAQRLSKQTLQPPCRVVSFTSQMRGTSLVDEIARTAQCDGAQAQEIYDRWLSRTQEGDVLTIEAVGILKFKNFTLDLVFDRLLNPQGHDPVRITSTRRFDWVMWLGVTVIVLVVGGGGALWMTNWNPLSMHTAERSATVASVRPKQLAETSPSGTSTSTSAPETVATESLPVSVTGVAGQPDSAQSPVQSDAQPSATAAPDAPAYFVSGHRYVVLGVFSSADNAARAIRDAVAKEPSLRYSVYHYAAKLMVSPFDSAESGACAQFIRDNEARFPGMWTYTAR